MSPDELQKSDATISAIRQGEAFARGFYEEAQGLFKASAVLDPELPFHLEAMVDDLSLMGSQIPGGPQMVEFVEKNSHAPEALSRFCQNVVDVDARARAEMEKTSFFRDVRNALLDPTASAKRQAASFGMSQAPRSQGALSWTDPVFDPTRGLRRLEPNSVEAVRMRALTPDQRRERGVYMDDDLSALAKNHKPSPRSLREATLVGTQQGIHRANTAKPSLMEAAKIELARRNAERLAYKARHSQIHGPYMGLLGTVEDALPTWKDKAVDMAADAGNVMRRIPRGALYAGGGLAALTGAVGIKEYLRDRQAKRNRMQYAPMVPAVTEARQAAPEMEEPAPPQKMDHDFPGMPEPEPQPGRMQHPMPGAM